MTHKNTTILKNIVNGLAENTLVEKPCKIIKVHSQNLVDIEYYDKYKTDILCNVPVKHLQTKDSYVFLKLKIGDRGTVRFLDNDLSYYNNGSEDSGNDNRSHNINDGIFSLGFYPTNEISNFSENDLVIKSGNATITFNNGDITITGGNVYIQGINFLEHTHTAGDIITSGVIVQ